MKELKILEKLCEGNQDTDVTLFEVPEVALGATNIIVEESPIVGALQLGKMAWSLVENKQTRKAIIDLVRHPRRTAQAFYDDKKDVYEGCLGQEKLLLSSGEDGATIVMAIWTGGAALISKIQGMGKKARGSVQKLRNVRGITIDIGFEMAY